MPATIHPGAIRHVWDHHVITLRDDAGRRTAFASLYAITYSATLGAGHVALLEIDDPTGPVSEVLSDRPHLGAAMQDRLRRMGYAEVDLGVAPLPARFDRGNLGPDGFGFSIAWESHLVELAWLRPEPPFWMLAPAPDLAPDEDIWAVFVEAPGASVTLDGRPVPGAPYADDVWQSKVGRPLSSAHVALSEVRVTPVAGWVGEVAKER